MSFLYVLYIDTSYQRRKKSDHLFIFSWWRMGPLVVASSHSIFTSVIGISQDPGSPAGRSSRTIEPGFHQHVLRIIILFIAT